MRIALAALALPIVDGQGIPDDPRRRSPSYDPRRRSGGYDPRDEDDDYKRCPLRFV